VPSLRRAGITVSTTPSLTPPCRQPRSGPTLTWSSTSAGPSTGSRRSSSCASPTPHSCPRRWPLSSRDARPLPGRAVAAQLSPRTVRPGPIETVYINTGPTTRPGPATSFLQREWQILGTRSLWSSISWHAAARTCGATRDAPVEQVRATARQSRRVHPSRADPGGRAERRRLLRELPVAPRRTARADPKRPAAKRLAGSPGIPTAG
jgi:hypothetical protein